MSRAARHGSTCMIRRFYSDNGIDNSCISALILKSSAREGIDAIRAHYGETRPAHHRHTVFAAAQTAAEHRRHNAARRSRSDHSIESRTGRGDAFGFAAGHHPRQVTNVYFSMVQRPHMHDLSVTAISSLQQLANDRKRSRE